MKKNIITLLILLGSTALFCQIQMTGSVEYRMKEQDIPYKVKHSTLFGRSDEIWRPLGSDYYPEWSPTIPYTVGKYWYDTIGILHKLITRPCSEDWNLSFVTYNETFTKEGYDFQDTMTMYKQKGDVVIPSYRNYYDYHYYDRMPEDSFYYVGYRENWNDAAKEWEPSYKEYLGHFDTTLFTIREISRFNFINGKWVMYSGMRLLLEFDEDGLVTSQLRQDCNPQTGEYETTYRYDYMYDEDKIHKETHTYKYLDENTWKLTSKSTDIQYIEWYPNGQIGITIIIYNGPEYVGIADKRVKRKTVTEWRLNNSNELEKYSLRNHEWDINGTKSHLDTVYLFPNDIKSLFYTGKNLYDERGNYTQKCIEYYSAPDEFGHSALYSGSKYYFLTAYHPLYDYPDMVLKWEWQYNLPAQRWDSTFGSCLAFRDWWDVTKPVSITENELSGYSALSIFPNPVSGMVTISATAEIQQLHVFDITGRLVKSPLPAGNQVVFDTGVLPAGVYLVRALLKDGGQRTGKVVILNN